MQFVYTKEELYLVYKMRNVERQESVTNHSKGLEPHRSSSTPKIYFTLAQALG